MAAMLSLFLLVPLPGTRLSCVVLPVESVNSPELEATSKLSRQVVSLFTENRFEEALAPAKLALEISPMNGQHRKNVRPGVEADIILKKDQGSARLTRGIVKDILTKSSFHPHGIKVRLVSEDVGRVQEVFDASDETP